MSYLHLQLTVFLLSFSKGHAEYLTVRLPDGEIRGHNLKSLNNFDYYAFHEIPYAAPPIGENRFKEPVDPVPWSGVRDATNGIKACSQSSMWPIADIPLNLTEDCLYLNVFTPQRPGGASNLLPVLVWIHGGGYFAGSGTYYSTGPKLFVDYGIVVVTLNYRLGPIGFLTTLDTAIPANNGLKDQRKALRWVNQNIKLFGGDPDQVTIAGESAGSYSVGFHLLSSNSKGLFRAAIQQSGTSMSRGAYSDNAVDFAFQLGAKLDSHLTPRNSSTDLLKVLQRASADQILSAGMTVNNEDISGGYLRGGLPWSPVIENSQFTNDPFLTGNMYERFLTGNYHHVPTIIGYTSEEALGFSGGAHSCPFGLSFDLNPALMVSKKLNIAEENRPLVGNLLEKIYTNKGFRNDIAACIRYSSDTAFVNPSIKQAQLTSRFAPIYLYQFAYAGTLGAPNGRIIVPGAEKVSHAEDLKYLWEFGYSLDDIPQEDILTVRRILTLWTNFVKYLNPTPEKDVFLERVIWPEVIASGYIHYLNINSSLEVRANPKHFHEINEIFNKYQQPPFVTW